MKFSIITATFNNQKTVEKALSSVESQTYTNYEHIIVDGVSSDDTLSIVAKYSHIRKVISEKDNGCLLYTSPSPRDRTRSRMPSSA